MHAVHTSTHTPTLSIDRRPARFAFAVLVGGLASILLSVMLWLWASRAGAATAVKASIANGVLTVTGTGSDEAITVRLKGGDATTLEVDVGADGSADFSFPRDGFTAIKVKGQGGADTLVLSTLNGMFTDTETSTLEGGGGNDQLFGANWHETLLGGDGTDLLDGNQGNDSLDGGGGKDTLQWDPGDGNDTVDGGAGADTAVFFGSAANEIYGVTTVADHVRLTRNVANVLADYDNVEALQINSFGGADIIQVGELAGTDLTELRTDLALIDGTDDGQVDEVAVRAGVVAGQNNGTAIIDGLGARVRVLNGGAQDSIHASGASSTDVVTIAGTSGPDTVNAYAAGADAIVEGATPGIFVRLTGVETLDTNLAAGDDSFAAVGNVAALVTLDVDGGLGNDTLRGGNGADLLTGGSGNDFVDGNQGNDIVTGLAGNDTFQWDPGDGNDTIDGGNGTDTTQFYGSAGNEIYTISNTNSHVQLLRNIGNVVSDYDNIEALHLYAFGGADIIQVNDLAGTDLTDLRTDLALLGGADDAQIDEVAVRPGLVIGQDNGTPVIDGLGPRVRVTGGTAPDSIHITGTPATDAVTIAGTSGPDTVNAYASGADVAVDGATPGIFVRLTTVETLDVNLLDDNDSFAAVGNVAALVTLDVDGGLGNDTLRGGNGADLLTGGDGDDFVDGNQGNDIVTGLAGNDTFQWDPGDGNDTIDGGNGTDTTQFYGSAGNEIYTISNTNSHVQLLRNIGNVISDYDNIEALHLYAFGGADIIQVNDLAGTDLTDLRTDLALLGGADDAQIDEVAVRPGLVIGQDNGTPVIDGLGPRVRVTGGTAPDSIHITGTPATDAVTIAGTSGPDTVNAYASGADVAVDGATPGIFVRLTTVETLDVNLLDDNDSFAAVGNVAALVTLDVDGGLGNDTLRGGNGADLLTGGDGDDFVDGNQGNDIVTGLAGNDTFQWDPGDGNDTIDGGNGTDTTQFYGSAGNEIYTISNTNSHVQLLRNIGNVVSDYDNIEALHLYAFGGADIIQVNDLAGTDLTDLRTDLALLGGADDAQIDSVVVNGTAGDDAIDVVDDGNTVVVQGLAVPVRVSGANPAADLLTVNGLEGSDTLNATPGATALILVSLVQ